MGNQTARVNVPMIRIVGIIKDHGEMVKDMVKEHTKTLTEESTLENGRKD